MAAYVWKYAAMLAPGKQKIVLNTYCNFPFLASIHGSIHVVVCCHVGARKTVSAQVAVDIR